MRKSFWQPCAFMIEQSLNKQTGRERVLFKNLFDSHVHSLHSPDGFDTVQSLCGAAVKAGLLGLCITDHWEVGDPEWGDFTGIIHSLADIDRAAQEYSSQLKVLRGIEIGQAHQNKALADEMLGSRRFDFIIGSLHKLLGRPDFYYLNYDEEDVPRLMREYYNELIETARFGRFDVMGHINYPVRYMPAHILRELNLSDYDEQVDELLYEIAAQGKGIEINTAGLTRKEKETYPPFRYLKRFRELGGEIVTIGSDAHCTENLGGHIQTAMAMLVEAGFSYHAFFRNRQPVMLKLV